MEVGIARRLYRFAMRQAAKGHLHAFRIYLRRLAGQGPTGPSGIEVRAVAEEELLAQLHEPELELPEDSARASYRRGEICAGAFRDGRLLGYCWYAFAPAPHVGGIDVTFPSDAVYAYRAFVREDSRGFGLGQLLFAFDHPAFHARGRESVVYCIETHNYPSIHAATRAGARAVGGLVCIFAGRRPRALYSRPVDDLGFRFRAAAIDLPTRTG